ncbi:TIGR04282 family arsenosugar biosynthesis glycosyltransferase [Rhodoferax sp.]|uniref:TIGR04282 family arsenosugar biosynthesis glycosyltransferase n=1 Tax=Rhodoferax sp. TaxID=50421 RepID=UPI00277559C2|nr:TIGR04282 family arsenosugar biosynthesis glycosyltransferase [Rhodoferax sp.]
MTASTRIVVMAKAPLPGFAKTRLIPALGETGAARLAARMLHHTLGTALAAAIGPVELCAAPEPSDPAWRGVAVPADVVWSAQGVGDLGARMARAAQRGCALGERVLLIGTDCPALSPAHLRSAATALDAHDATLLPTFDGGYALLGLRQIHPSLFENMPWSTATVATQTVQRARQVGWSVELLPRLHDIDEPDDLQWLPPAWLHDQESARHVV